MSEETRRFSRIPFKVKSQLLIDDQVYLTPELSNLSVGGCLLPLSGTFPQGTPCLLKIFLEGTIEEMSIQVEGEIVRSTPDGIALKFLRIEPESLFHLHNIILYNAPDPDIIEHEISRHPGLK
ncbi:MAG TPA: hypothetical protein DDY20_01340 [Desulfobulbaceae bacterium]|nr:hypothetical protein [Desulfobulbaceae bacterium]